jgi:branched-chain amino acid transport system substrate-binding protein
LKKIVFLLIASLLVIGLVLPGCEGEGEGEGEIEFDSYFTFAVADAMTDITGENAWAGAEMARDEINAAGGVDVGGEIYGIDLVQVDTNEVSGTPDQGVTALQSVIDDVDIVVGGFRTENVVVYREVAMEAKKLFMDCGAATGSLQYSVVEDYDTYKYWFKTTPYNEAFLVKSCLKMTSTIGTSLKNELIAQGDAVLDDYQVSDVTKLRVAIVMENAEWCAGMVTVGQAYLPGYGFDVVGTWLVSPTATDVSTELTQLEAKKAHIIFTAFSGPVGAVFSKQKAELGIPAMVIGINVPGAEKEHWTNTDGKCQGEVILDTFPEGVQPTSKTTAFFNAFMTKTGRYPGYTAVTYDAIYTLKGAVEAVSAANGWDDIADVLDPANIDALIQYLETTPYTGTGATTCYYPMPDVDLGGGTYALSEAQVRALYPDLDKYVQDQWQVQSYASDGPHIAHDTVYGPGYQTGAGSQWQDGKKVGVWPMDLGDEYDEALTDQYGCWNFEYPGAADLFMPIDAFLAS